MGSVGKSVTDLQKKAFDPLGIGESNKAVKPQAAPKAPAPVTAEDPNVKAAAMMKKSRLSQTGRASARRLLASQTPSTLG